MTAEQLSFYRPGGRQEQEREGQNGCETEVRCTFCIHECNFWFVSRLAVNQCEIEGSGGSASNGTVFSLTFPPPQLTIITSAANFILNILSPAAQSGYARPSLASPEPRRLSSSLTWVQDNPET